MVESLEDRRLLAAGGNEQLTGLIGNETATAVDPNNPDVVAVSQFRTVAISSDGGATFPTTVTVTPPLGYGGRGGDPTLSFDSQGRLYFGYLASNPAPATPNIDLAVFAARINPSTGAIDQNAVVALETATDQHDKEWVAADSWAGSPFRDNAYMIWSQLSGTNAILFSRTTDNGATWSPSISLNGAGQGFVWPSEVAVAPNGDVWAGWHTHTANTAGNLGEIRLRVSSDGGQTFGPELVPFPAGTADITDNAPPNPSMPGLISWMQGSVQPRILIDPVRPNNVYVVSVDDPDNNYAAGDPADIVFARSTDYGATWTRSTISHAPFGTIQVMPSAYIDENGNLAVMWYDTRNGVPSVGVDQIPGTADDNLLLDVFVTVSQDGGLTWSNDFQINETPYDPDLGPPPDRFPPNNVLRIGEYNGQSSDSDLAFVSWTANSGNQQDIAFDVFSMGSAFSDRFESNNTQGTATSLGQVDTLTVADLTIDPGDSAADVDFFRVSPLQTGTLRAEIHFTHRAGDLSLAVQDALGNVIASSTSTTDDEAVEFAAVAGEEYFIVVSGVNGNTNSYDLVVHNTPVLPPPGVDLAPASDTGISNEDHITADNTPTITVQSDLQALIDASIPIDTNGAEGADVDVLLTNVASGVTVELNATRTGLSQLWEATAPALVDGRFSVTARLRMTDGQVPSETGFGPLAEPTWITIDTVAPTGSAPDLIAASDTGFASDDNVTNLARPTFAGTGEPGAFVRLLADGVVVGEGVVQSNGEWRVTSSPLFDGVYAMTAEYEDLAGNVSSPAGPLNVEIDTRVPNTPWLDLIAADDSGRSNDDDVTNVTTPHVDLFARDTEAPSGHLFTDNVRFRIYDRVDGGPETLIVNQTALVTDGEYTRQLFADGISAPLADGRHSLKLEVEDRAGNYSHDFLLEIVVDTVAPPTPTVTIDPATSDSGVTGYPATSTDRITNDTTTGFRGTAESDSIVRLFANGHFDGFTVAVPFDGNEASTGIWQQTGALDLNDPVFFPHDGPRAITATAEDVAGNISTPAQLDIFIDTQGPRVTDVFATTAPAYDLFGPKPATAEPSPLISQLSVRIEDAPNRSNILPAFLYDAVFEPVAETLGQVQVIGDHNGIIPITSLQFVGTPPADGVPGSGTLQILFDRALPDDRYTLSISDGIVDRAGNALDGESNASEPVGTPTFPSGDLQPGGTFRARFTVDSRAEIGVAAAGSVYIDTNGNFVEDSEGKDRDDSNEDITYVLGFTSDDIFVGNFSAGGPANGFDKLAAYGRVGGAWRWLIDTDDDGVPNIAVTDPAAVNGLPVAGNFDGVAANGDEVAAYTGNTWHFDTNHDFLLDTAIASNMPGYPVVGDFDGDGIDDLGTWTDDTFSLDLSSSDGVIDGQTDRSFRFGFIGVRERPVAADMDGDGIDDLGLWVPDRSGSVPSEVAEWYFLVSGGASIETRIVTDPIGGGDVVDFRPVPFGNDIFARFGDDFALPVVGNLDPPVSPLDSTTLSYLSFQNPRDFVDVNDDGLHTPQDALLVLNALSGNGAQSLPLIRTQSPLVGGPYVDVNGDFRLTPSDVLQVINRLLERSDGEGEGAALLAGPFDHASSDGAFGQTASPATGADLAHSAWLIDPEPTLSSDYASRIGHAATNVALIDEAFESVDRWSVPSSDLPSWEFRDDADANADGT